MNQSNEFLHHFTDFWVIFFADLGAGAIAFLVWERRSKKLEDRQRMKEQQKLRRILELEKQVQDVSESIMTIEDLIDLAKAVSMWAKEAINTRALTTTPPYRNIVKLLSNRRLWNDIALLDARESGWNLKEAIDQWNTLDLPPVFVQGKLEKQRV
jgi:hypothetical protein